MHRSLRRALGTSVTRLMGEWDSGSILCLGQITWQADLFHPRAPFRVVFTALNDLELGFGAAEFNNWVAQAGAFRRIREHLRDNRLTIHRFNESDCDYILKVLHEVDD